MPEIKNNDEGRFVLRGCLHNILFDRRADNVQTRLLWWRAFQKPRTAKDKPKNERPIAHIRNASENISGASHHTAFDVEREPK
jgi:hypothetical protein